MPGHMAPTHEWVHLTNYVTSQCELMTIFQVFEPWILSRQKGKKQTKLHANFEKIRHYWKTSDIVSGCHSMFSWRHHQFFKSSNPFWYLL